MKLPRRTNNLLALSLAVLGLSGSAFAQSKSEAPSADAKPCDYASYPTATSRIDCYERNRVVKTYFLANVTQQNDANEVLIALRNVLDTSTKLYLINSDEAIVVAAPPDQQAIAKKLIAELDVPKKAYRLTFTLADSDNGKRVGVQHFSIVIAPGQRTTLKQGSKIPVITGSYSGNTPGVQTQFQYLDIGMNFDVTLTDSPGGLLLKSKVEDTAVGSTSEFRNSSGPLAQEPIIQQTSLEGTSMLTLHKPITLGSIDVPSSTRHIDVEVVADPVS